MGQRFSAHRLDENQATSTGAKKSENRWSVKQSWHCNVTPACRGPSRLSLRLAESRKALGKTYLAIVNPAAGGGRSTQAAGPRARTFASRRASKSKCAALGAPGHATEIAREAYRRGVRNFIAVGGDGTAYEVVNGLFPEALGGERPTLGFLPLGTGNSFLRDFSDRGVEYAIESLIAGRSRSCDVLRLRHRTAYPLHQSSEHGILGRCGDPARTPFQRLGRARLSCFDFSDSRAFQPPAVSGARRGRGRIRSTARACFSPLTTASSPAAR